MNTNRWLTYYSEKGLNTSINYNKLFKPAYLPGCVRHSQAIFWGCFFFALYRTRGDVSKVLFQLTRSDLDMGIR